LRFSWNNIGLDVDGQVESGITDWWLWEGIVLLELDWSWGIVLFFLLSYSFNLSIEVIC
jgi:hypothetical protein